MTDGAQTGTLLILKAPLWGHPATCSTCFLPPTPCPFLNVSLLFQQAKASTYPCTSPPSPNQSYSLVFSHMVTILELKITRNLQPLTLNLAKHFQSVLLPVLAVSAQNLMAHPGFFCIYTSLFPKAQLGCCPDWHWLRGML